MAFPPVTLIIAVGYAMALYRPKAYKKGVMNMCDCIAKNPANLRGRPRGIPICIAVSMLVNPIEVWLHAAKLLMALALLVTPVAVVWAAPAQDDHDPFYSDEFHALMACAGRHAQSYRYNYDTPAVSSSEQVAAFLRRVCATEIAALVKLVRPSDRHGAPEELVGELDSFVVGPYFYGEPSRSLEERFGALPAPGTSVRERTGRITYFRAANGFSEGELAGVLRQDALGSNRYNTFPWWEFIYYGQREGWIYSYDRRSDFWDGEITKKGVTAYISCDPNLNFVYSVSGVATCKLFVPNLLSIKAERKQPSPLKLCNPGHFETGHMPLRPPPPAGSPRNSARRASFIIDDGEPIMLPDGDKCLTIDQNLLARIAQSKHLRSSFIPRFDTRTVTAEGNGEVVAAGLALFERLRTFSFDKRATTEVDADQATLRERAQPFTLADALSAYDEWEASVTCVAAHGENNKACDNWLADLVWRAASFSAKDELEADRLAQHPEDAAKRTEVSSLVHSEAKQRQSTGARLVRKHFSGDEERTSVMGQAGFAGHVEASNDAVYGNRFQQFGYAVEGRTAWGVIPADRFGGVSGPSLQSTTIVCDGERAPVCTIRISTSDGKGAFLVHTDGSWHGAVPCVTYDGRNLAGWRLYDYAYIFDKTLGLLDENGCVSTGRPAVMRSLMHQEYGPALAEPGSDPEKSKRILLLQNVNFALALARFLTQQVKS